MEKRSPLSATLLPAHLRSKLAADPELGCGNFLRIAERTNPFRNHPMIWMERPCRTLHGETFDSFSLTDLKRVSDEYAAWYYGAGVRSRDVVGVFIEDGVECLIHWVALTSLGAVPSLINGNMLPEIAAGFLKKIGAVGLFTDTARDAAVNAHIPPTWGLRFNVTNEVALQAARPVELPRHLPYRHLPTDPVLIGHSSGTTGIPKAVEFAHQQFFHGIRFRLGQPMRPGTERLLSALPHSHSAGLAYVMLALLNGAALLVLSDHGADSVLEGIERFEASMIAAFPETFVRVSERDFSKYDLNSVRVWVNGGDAAHEPHIRKLLTAGSREVNGERKPGSIFVDGLGSSEMGFSLFGHLHTPDTDDYNRCIGVPHPWVDATVLNEIGEKVPPYQIGRLGVAGPSITPGYWNDTGLTWRSRVNGYFLTGDLFYYDERGRFFHVDRVPDAITTREGMVYSLQTEELLLKHCPRLADISLIAVPAEEGFSVAVAVARLKRDERNDPDRLLEELNAILSSRGKLPLAGVVVADSDEIPLGTTGKVLKRELRSRLKPLFARGAATRGSIPEHRVAVRA